jgi:glutamine kinase
VIQHLREIDDVVLDTHLQGVSQRFEELQRSHPFVMGDKTIFGVMPDWNPAEIVGIKPKTLAISLYQQLITNDIWAQQRSEFGYKDVRPYPLIICFAGHPYVDVRASIHSFLPAALEASTTRKLVNYYVERLRQHPEWHDKLEFMVMPTCLSFDFEERWHSLLTQEAGLSEEEFQSYRQSLQTLTQEAFQKCSQEYSAMNRLNQTFEAIEASGLSTYDKIYVLLQTCRQGTLNFSHLARCGFLASSFIKSALAKGAINEAERDALLDPIKTITGSFFEETQRVLNGEISRTDFIHKYGHLRPGTYDITSPAYKTDPNKYMFSHSSKQVHTTSKNNTFDNSGFEHLLKETLGINLAQFKQFLEEAIAGREYSKFVFTRYISSVLDLIEGLGRDYGIPCQDMAHLSINTILDVKNGILKGEDTAEVFKKEIIDGKNYHRITQSIELPPLITQKSDFFSFALPKTLPNFIGNQSVQASLIYLENSKETAGDKLRGKIILIENADPGFDWIFNYDIAGLITVYGGPNSHMAIRSAEFKLAASIGIGNALFEKLKTAQLIELDCASQSIKIIH